MLGATTTCTVIVALGSWLAVPGVVAIVVAVGVALAGLVHAAILFEHPLPQRKGQIPQTNLREGRWWGPLLYGAEVGVGFRTKVPNATPYVLAATLFVFASLPAGAAVSLGWALGRVLSLAKRQLGMTTHSPGRKKAGLYASSSTLALLVVFISLVS